MIDSLTIHSFSRCSSQIYEITRNS